MPAGLTLPGLRQDGAPFRGGRYFHEFAPGVVEAPTVAHAVAYRPVFLQDTLNRRFEECAALVDEFGRNLPPGCGVTIGSAAVYVYVFWEHARRTGAFPLAGRYTWTTDTCPDGHLIVGVFGEQRPLVVAPHATSGAGVGVVPLIVPTTSATPAAEQTE